MKKTTLLLFVSIYFNTNPMLRIAGKKYTQKSCHTRLHSFHKKILVPSIKKNLTTSEPLIAATFCAILEQNIFTIPSLCFTYPCLRDAAITINALAQTNSFLNKLIDDDKNTLKLITEFSQHFDCPNINVARALCTKAANSRFILQEALFHIRHRRFEEIKDDLNKMKSMGLDLDFTYSQELPTMLLQSVSWQEYGNHNIAIWLMENGADITMCTPEKRNASTIALAGYNKFLMHKILDHSAFDIHHQDSNNDTPLHCCFYSTSLPYLDQIIKQLLGKGANSTIVNNKGKTPLDLAKASKDRDLIDLLEKVILSIRSK